MLLWYLRTVKHNSKINFFLRNFVSDLVYSHKKINHKMTCVLSLRLCSLGLPACLFIFSTLYQGFWTEQWKRTEGWHRIDHSGMYAFVKLLTLLCPSTTSSAHHIVLCSDSCEQYIKSQGYPPDMWPNCCPASSVLIATALGPLRNWTLFQIRTRVSLFQEQ